MNTSIIFIILLALMLAGMPISIGPGLTVLSFLFTFTHVPLESVGALFMAGVLPGLALA
jgi:C4-dicarboxylate transporter DctM subunit